ncbi:MAG: hypothetical protein AAB152_14905 [Candidatus Coatesbacteria bacterium]
MILPALLFGAVSLSATVLEAPASPSTTLSVFPGLSSTGLFGESISRMQVRGLALHGTQEVDLVVPDGASRLVVENAIGRSLVRMGLYYNFVNGRIETWITYALSVHDGTQVQVAASDVIGLGRLYLNEKFLERAQTIPVGIGQALPFGSVLVNVQRTYWRLAPFDNPPAAEVGHIDAVGAEFTAGGVVPDLVEALRLEPARRDQTRVRFRHAFRGLGGDYHFDRVDSDVRAWVRGLRPRDQILVRGVYGQAWNVSPILPVRESFGLGGLDALRGYRFEEFRGPGLAMLGTEYAFRLPWTMTFRLLRLGIEEADCLAFGEAGRIQDDWFRGSMRFRWSGGLGARVRGTLFKSTRSSFRVYAAQGERYPARRPVFYAVADIG